MTWTDRWKCHTWTFDQASSKTEGLFYIIFKVKGMIPTGPYLLICDLYRSLISTHRGEGQIPTGLVVIRVIWVSERPLWLKCLLWNPFLWFPIGSFRILLNYAFHGWWGGGGGKRGLADKKWNVPFHLMTCYSFCGKQRRGHKMSADFSVYCK